MPALVFMVAQNAATIGSAGMSLTAPLHTVVCLEDDLDLASLIEVTVQAWPATVHVAHDGVRAEADPRVTDRTSSCSTWGCPASTGGRSAASSSDPELCQIPIVVLTAVPIENQDRRRLAQVADYPRQPFTLGHLRHALQPLLMPVP